MVGSQESGVKFIKACSQSCVLMYFYLISLATKAIIIYRFHFEKVLTDAHKHFDINWANLSISVFAHHFVFCKCLSLIVMILLYFECFFITLNGDQ